jgi:hypothetical protein
MFHVLYFWALKYIGISCTGEKINAKIKEL